MEKYVCIHGHFYQPPRENPWLEAVELQDSAYPYHDWNERITTECYAPNGAARILDDRGHIADIVSNYSRISFNFGPTLLSWLEERAPECYRAVLDADRNSQQSFSGHGSALAQAYNHMILPLANERDRRTQVTWGIRDFQHRFQRFPEGLWLPETAVDVETLDTLAEMGIRFTILSPFQASRVRRIGGEAWQDVKGARIDPTMAYMARLPSGRSIVLFFYDGAVSQAVAFGGLLASGEQFASRLVGSIGEGKNWAPLAHVATDGETYGHHHRHGDMALAHALRHIESNHLARITNYGEYLQRHPPTHEVEVIEDTSWSCFHGIERWRSDCGCSGSRRDGWSQGWRRPLRESLDTLRDKLTPSYEVAMGRLVTDPWVARDDYISLVLDRSPEARHEFLEKHTLRPLRKTEQSRLLKLLEMQRYAMLMYTSCGWFFDDPSGIETVQVLRYAGRAIQLAEEVFHKRYEERFLGELQAAKSNVPEHHDATQIYQRFVKPSVVNLEMVAAHYAVSSLFDEYPATTNVYCYSVKQIDYQSRRAGKAMMAVGQAKVDSLITLESASLTFGVLYFGDHNLNCGVRVPPGREEYRDLKKELVETFARADLPEALRQLDRHFQGASYSLKSLFRDEQRRILGPILESSLSVALPVFRQIYEHHVPLLHFLRDVGMPLPGPLRMTAEIVLNVEFRRAFEGADLDVNHVSALLSEAKRWDLELDAAGLGYALRQTVERMSVQLWSSPSDVKALRKLEAAVTLVRSLPFWTNLWTLQNMYYEMLRKVGHRLTPKSSADPATQEWATHFVALGEKLGVRVQW